MGFPLLLAFSFQSSLAGGYSHPSAAIPTCTSPTCRHSQIVAPQISITTAHCWVVSDRAPRRDIPRSDTNLPLITSMMFLPTTDWCRREPVSKRQKIKMSLSSNVRLSAQDSLSWSLHLKTRKNRSTSGCGRWMNQSAHYISLLSK